MPDSSSPSSREITGRKPKTAWCGALIFLILTLPCQALVYTSTVNGNWNSAATWGGVGVPGNGDTVLVNTLVAVTANVTVGASNGNYVLATNAGAIQTNLLGAVSVANGITLTIRGDWVVNNQVLQLGYALTLGAGSSFIFDSSTTSPTTTVYRYMPIGDALFYHSILGNGTCDTLAHHAIITSNPGGANGQVFMNGHNYGGGYNLTCTDVSNLGSASYNAWESFPYFGSIPFAVNHFTCTGCGTFADVGGMQTSTVVSWANFFFSGSTGATNLSGYVFSVQPSGGGLYSFANGVFDISYCNTCATVGVIFNTIYFGDTAQLINYAAASSTWAQFTNVLHNHQSNPGTDIVANGNISGAIFLNNFSATNPHGIEYNSYAPEAFSDMIFEYINTSGPGHFIMFNTDSKSAAYAYTLRNILTIPNAGGDSPGYCTGIAATTSLLTIDFKNNTCMIGSGSTTAAFTSYGESGNAAAGTFTRIKDSIAWDTSARNGKILDVNVSAADGIVTDVVAPANADYNDGWKFVLKYPTNPAWFTNEGNGYQAAYSSTPGVHDLNLNPMFFDVTRNTATFDTAYLHHTASATWASEPAGHTFAKGDIISESNAGWYAGTVINYRCILSHVKSTANSEPGIGSANQTYWEMATLYDIRSAMQNGTTYTDPVLGLVAADPILTLRTWIKYGFQITNPLLAHAASDGGVIGAEPFLATSNGFFQDGSTINGVKILQ